VGADTIVIASSTAATVTAIAKQQILNELYYDTRVKRLRRLLGGCYAYRPVGLEGGHAIGVYGGRIHLRRLGRGHHFRGGLSLQFAQRLIWVLATKGSQGQ
jgi:hypothetical protein